MLEERSTAPAITCPIFRTDPESRAAADQPVRAAAVIIAQAAVALAELDAPAAEPAVPVQRQEEQPQEIPRVSEAQSRADRLKRIIAQALKAAGLIRSDD